jgi:hypothetical protein
METKTIIIRKSQVNFAIEFLTAWIKEDGNITDFKVKERNPVYSVITVTGLDNTYLENCTEALEEMLETA